MSDLISEVEIVHERFGDLEQQRETSIAGMWLFLATEVMFFGALFLAYTVYRVSYPAMYAAMSRHMDIFKGTLNTAVLLTSSLTMALAVHAAHKGQTRNLVAMLFTTFWLGVLFMYIKLSEWHEEAVAGFYPPSFNYHGPHADKGRLFFGLYYIMTGLHGLHVMIGLFLIAIFIYFSLKKKFNEKHYMPIEILGLYWHFVDLVWIFLYPLFYLVSRT